MKKFFLLFILLPFITIVSYAQDANAFWKEFQRLYNLKQFSTIYEEMISNDFKKELSESDWISFMADMVYAQGGNLDSFRLPLETKVILYLEKMTLSGDFFLSIKNQLDGVTLQPYQNNVLETVMPHSNNPLLTTLDKTIDEKVQEFYTKTNSYSQLSIAVIDKDKLHYFHYAPQKMPLPSEKSIYEIGSLTKTFTGLLICQAILEKRLSLDTDIRTFFPGEYPNLEIDAEFIKIKHLLTHTSGLPRLPLNYNRHPLFSILDPYKNYTDTLLLDELRVVQLSNKPGVKIDYSNLGFTILGYILRQVYQDDLENVYNSILQKEFGIPSISFSLVPNMLKSYDADQNEVNAWTFYEASGVAAAGGIKSDINVMANYILAQIEEKHPSIKLSHEVLFRDEKTSIASAWIYQSIKGIEVYWHNGATGGSTSFAAFHPAIGKGIVILNNTSQSVDGLAVNIIQDIFK